MANRNIQPIIDILSKLASSSQLDNSQMDEAIEVLERVKSTINAEDDETIDKVDEIQDYLEYVMTAKNPILEEIQEEISTMMKDVQEWSK